MSKRRIKTNQSNSIYTSIDEFFSSTKTKDELNHLQQVFFQLWLMALGFAIFITFLSYTYGIIIFLDSCILFIAYKLAPYANNPLVKILSATTGLGIIILHMNIHDPILNYAFKNKTQQKFCGEYFAQHEFKHGKSYVTYWYLYNYNIEQRFKFVEDKKYSFFSMGDNLCVYYAEDKNWSDYPYIYKIERDENSSSHPKK